MEIINLTKEYEQNYLMCMEEWSDEMLEAGNHKCQWYERMKDQGLGVKIAVNEKNEVCGMIQYVPIAFSPAIGEDMYFIDCIWIHGYKEGVGNYQKQGIGSQLLAACEEDVKSRGYKGVAAWGISLPFWMKASWYKKKGYKKADKIGMQVLLWKSFSDEARAPKWIKQVKKPVKNINPGKVTVTVFYNGRCQVPCITLERAKRAAAMFREQVVLQKINTFERQVFMEWGITDGLYIEDKNIATGPPLSYEKIVKAIEKRLKKVKS